MQGTEGILIMAIASSEESHGSIIKNLEPYFGLVVAGNIRCVIVLALGSIQRWTAGMQKYWSSIKYGDTLESSSKSNKDVTLTFHPVS